MSTYDVLNAVTGRERVSPTDMLPHRRFAAAAEPPTPEELAHEHAAKILAGVMKRSFEPTADFPRGEAVGLLLGSLLQHSGNDLGAVTRIVVEELVREALIARAAKEAAKK